MRRRDIVVFLLGGLCGVFVACCVMITIWPLFGVTVKVSTQDKSSESVRPSLPENALSYALDGYCAVTLLEELKWQLGDTRWSETHDGQLFLLSGAVEQQRFRDDPERYAPRFSGNDVVLAKDEQKIVRGKREHGLNYQQRIVLFASEESLQRFAQNPKMYIPDDDLRAAETENAVDESETRR